MLVLHDKDLKPEILPKGKVAGVKDITIQKTYLNRDDRSFWQKVLEGGIMIHITRFFMYCVVFLICFSAIAIPSVIISEWINNKKREKNINRLKIESNRPFSDEESYIVHHYSKYGSEVLIKLITMRTYEKSAINTYPTSLVLETNSLLSQARLEEIIETLISKGKIEIQEKNIIFKDGIDKFIEKLIS